MIDFGLSVLFTHYIKEDIDDKIGTLLYMAPEQIQRKPYNTKVDVFACGVIIYEMIVGNHPLYEKGDTQMSYM